MFVTGGHFAGAAGIARAQRLHPRLAAGSLLLSALDPLPDLVRQLDEFRPSILAGIRRRWTCWPPSRPPAGCT